MHSASRLFLTHIRKVVALVVIVVFQLLLNITAGESKSFSDINWMDFFGEGSATILALAWLTMVLTSRPSGYVTNMLCIGLVCVCVAFGQDVMDEFITLPDTTVWDTWLESGIMPIGLFFLTLGLYAWHEEQLAINNQLLKRERIFRDHRQLDSITGIGKAGYIRQQIELELIKIADTQQPFSIVMLDVDNFDSFNRLHGNLEADRFLSELSELLLLNIRRCDLLSRYAGDRFVLLLPSTGVHMARMQAQQLVQACEHFAYKTSAGESVYVTVTSGLTSAMEGKADDLLQDVNRDLQRVKQDKLDRLHRVA